MAHTRRHFARLLQAGAAYAVAGLRPDRLATAGFETKAAGGTLAGGSHRSVFAVLTGSEFRVTSSLADAPASLTLRAVESMTKPGKKALVPRQRTPDVEYTTLRFSGKGAALPEGTYRLEHATAGVFELHLNPGPPGRYRAHFSRLPEGYLASISIPRGPAQRTENVVAGNRVPDSGATASQLDPPPVTAQGLLS
jgi:hypothetical protein